MKTGLLSYASFAQICMEEMGWITVPLDVYYTIYVAVDGDGMKTINGIAMWHMLQNEFEGLVTDEQLMFASKLRVRQEFAVTDIQLN